MTAMAMPLEARRAIDAIRAFHALFRDLASAPADLGQEGLDAIGARLHGRVAEMGYGIGHKNQGAGRSDAGGEIGYVMVALADESLIRLIDWPGQERWPDKLLEERIYGTRVAGDRVFSLADSLHYRRDSDRIGLAAAIYLALLMGFRGRYADDEPPGLIEQMLNELHTIAFGPRRDVGSAIDGLDACGLGEALAPMPVKRLPSLRPWMMGSALVVLVYLGASHWLWSQGVQTIIDRAAVINEQLE